MCLTVCYKNTPWNVVSFHYEKVGAPRLTRLLPNLLDEKRGEFWLYSLVISNRSYATLQEVADTKNTRKYCNYP